MIIIYYSGEHLAQYFTIYHIGCHRHNHIEVGLNGQLYINWFRLRRGSGENLGPLPTLSNIISKDRGLGFNLDCTLQWQIQGSEQIRGQVPDWILVGCCKPFHNPVPMSRWQICVNLMNTTPRAVGSRGLGTTNNTTPFFAFTGKNKILRLYNDLERTCWCRV